MGLRRRLLQSALSLQGRDPALARRRLDPAVRRPWGNRRRGGIRKICVVPKPYQQPHPPMFQPFSVSETTIRYTAQSSIVPWILVANPPDFQRLCKIYEEVAGETGRKLGLGESVGAFRAVHFGKTEAEAVALLRDTNYSGFQNYFGGFGFWEAFRTPEDAA